MAKKDYSEEVLIQEATADLLAKQLGWQSVLAWCSSAWCSRARM